MLLRTSNQNGKGMAKLVPPSDGGAEARRQQALADSSIMNHHRYKSRLQQQQQMTTSDSMPDLRSRDVSPFQSRLAASASSFSPAHPNAASNDDEGPNFSRHLRQSFYKQDNGDSGRFLESISDEAWEAIDGEPTSSKSKNWRDDHYEQQRSERSGMALTSDNSHASDHTDDARAIGWPLGKAYSAFSKILSNESKSESTYARTPSTDSKQDSSYSRTPSTDSKNGSSYMRTASTESKAESAYTRTSSNDMKYDSSYLRTPSSDSKGESFQSYSDFSSTNFPQQKESAADKFSPVSVLQPPLPKGPRESWLGKLMAPAPAPLSNMSNWQQAGPKKFLEHSISEDSMDVKWEALVKSKNALARNLKLAQIIPSASTGSYGGT
ncbi:hypothetical protein Mapa_015072 [Marchantia paleacea]|nr:hypothetical protein Mapa_015072 [Marchantia paleacea]